MLILDLFGDPGRAVEPPGPRSRPWPPRRVQARAGPGGACDDRPPPVPVADRSDALRHRSPPRTLIGMPSTVMNICLSAWTTAVVAIATASLSSCTNRAVYASLVFSTAGIDWPADS